MIRESAISANHSFRFLMVSKDTKTYTMSWLALRLSPCFRPSKPSISIVSVAFLVLDLANNFFYPQRGSIPHRPSSALLQASYTRSTTIQTPHVGLESHGWETFAFHDPLVP